jgi:3-hydroxy-9,10-secoandrosta-1,3,5(10)-triene-9,17-dione monooxygenase reductase component
MQPEHAAIDPKRYRQTVGRFLTGVTVVACDVAGEVQAMTANSFTSLSLDPPLVLFCPGKHTKTGQQVANFRSFSVNVLREEQQAISNYFAGGWKQPDPPPFRFVRQDQIPRLEGSLASLLCTVHEIYEGGDHWIVVGRVLGLHEGIEPLRPLGFHLGRYALLEQATTRAPDLYETSDPEPVHYHYQSW